MPRHSCDGSALRSAALSVAAHAAAAIVVLWGGVRLFENRSGSGESQPAIDWVALPGTPTPTVTGPTIAAPSRRRLKRDVAPTVVATALPLTLPRPLHASPPAPAPLPVPVASDEPGSGDFGKGPTCGDAREVSATLDADADPGVDGTLVSTTAGTRPDDAREHDVQFWIRADGRVSRIAVTPPIADPDYRRRFMEAMNTFVFGPVKTRDGRSIDYVYRCVV